MFLPNIIKIDPYNFELYRFKVGPFFETQCRMPLWQRMMRESTVSKVLQIWSFPHLFKGTLKDPEQHISY